MNEDSYCLVESEYKFGDINYDDSPEQIEKVIGKPDSIVNNLIPSFELWYYKDLIIGVTNKHPFYFRARSSEIKTPSGICLGRKRKEIEKIIVGNRRNIKFSKKDKVQIVNCATEYYLIMEFESDILTKFEMGIDLP